MSTRSAAASDPARMPSGPASAPALCSSTRLLVIAPHPDDETIATGVLIQQVLAAGGEVQALSLTPGDNNPWPQRWLERRWGIGPAERQRWGARRHEELLRATAQLGLDPAQLRTLGWPDQGLTDRLRHAMLESVEAIRAQIEAFAPNLVAIPALDDGHPDHSAAHVLARLALSVLALRPCCIAYGIHAVENAPADGHVHWPSSESQRARKRAALECHVTQLALSAGRMRRFAERPEHFVRVPDEAEWLGSGILPWRPPRLLAPWLLLTAVTRTGARSWRWSEAPLQRDENGDYRLRLPDEASTGHCFARLELQWPTPWVFDHWGWCEVRA